MAHKIINNLKQHDGNIARNKPHEQPPSVVSILPDLFITTTAELEVLKWALQFYMYQEKQQKISGKIFINDVTDEKKEIATRLLQRLT